MSEWQPIETAPHGVYVLGRKDTDRIDSRAYFIGTRYDLRKGALLDEWHGRWAVCTHWTPLPTLPSARSPDAGGDQS